ncbi:MAG: 1-hydroxycarotenoid 3,4-desaturase CrtD [Parvularculaceae bacterium]
MAKKRVAIVGAGVAGLAAAAILARRFDVLVFERDARPGGKIRAAEIDGRRIDCGPTVFTMRRVFEEIFAAAGANLDDHIELTPLDVLARHAWTDGSRLDLYADATRSAAAIAKFAGAKDADNFTRFRRAAADVYETLYGPFIRAERPSLLRLMLRRDPLSLMRLDPYASLWRSLSRRFDDPRLRQMFARYATYCGSSPFKAPATLMLIAHVEQLGVWRVTGGVARLAEALAELAAENGARLAYEACVDEITDDGVRLESGEPVRADAVLMNADLAALAAGRFGARARRAAPRRLRHATAPAKRTQSALTWSFLGDAAGFDLSMHNVFFSDDYAAEFDAVAAGRLPETPTTYVHAPDRPRPPDASSPERFFCLVNAPAVGDARRFPEEEISSCQKRTFEHLKRCGLIVTPDPTRTIVTTPNDFEARFPATGGALFGAPNHGWRASFQRPGARTPAKGLYLAGGSAHPGSGVPMAAISGAMAASAITADLAST